MIHPKLERGLAGLEAGMFGGIALLVVMAGVSVLDGRSAWTFPNLLASVFYGQRTVSSGVGWPFLAGSALQLLIAGVAGFVFGFAAESAQFRRGAILISIAWGILLFYLSTWTYGIVTPVVLLYVPTGGLMVAHMVYGVCLARTNRIAQGSSAEPVVPDTAEPFEAETGMRSSAVSQNVESPAVPVVETSSGEPPETGTKLTG